MTSIRLENVAKSFGGVDVIRDVSLDIATGEFVVFVGPSGCGKSTLLKMIAGLEGIDQGDLLIDGARANDTPPAQRGIAMVFQSYALYPHMTVAKNMGFSLKIAGKPKAFIEERVQEAAQMLQLTPLLKRYPKELSGGQRQRVAIGRAIVREAGVFLFDEPLSNLDAALRVATRFEIAALKRQLPGTTMIYVTHDQVEAMTLADRIVVLNAGRIEQVGSPTELYHHPQNRFVAGFIGSPAMNFLPCRIETTADAAQPVLDGKMLPARFRPAAQPQTEGTLGVRPEHLVPSGAAEALVSGEVSLVEELGEVTILHLQTAQGAAIIGKLQGSQKPALGTRLHFTAAPEVLHLFGSDAQALPRL